MDATDAVGHRHHRSFGGHVGAVRQTLYPTFDQLGDFGCVELHVRFLCKSSAFLYRWRYAANDTRMCSNRDRTEASYTSSPTTTRTPPISCGSTCTDKFNW